MDKNKKYLSASRIKTLQSCSWKYYCKYELKLPEANNDGAKRGTICHLVFEVLGNKRHRKHFTKIIRKQNPFASKAVEKLVRYHAAKEEVDDNENMELIKEMIMHGLNWDFFGLHIGKPTHALSEYDFEIEKNDYPIRYNVVGFIDKLFLYKTKGMSIVRDFKTSKSMFKEAELEDNLQDWIYSLAVRNDFPEYQDRSTEFVFLRHMSGEAKRGVQFMNPITDEMLDAFELELSHYQQLVENFTHDDAISNFAANQGFPDDNTFSGKLQCGFADYKFHLKNDGSFRWHCPFKFDFEYYSIIDSEGNVVKSYLEDDFDEDLVPDDCMWVKMTYDGCPRFKS
jgi:hypothetical protein